MIDRLYIHNFRCFENADVSFGGQASTLLIGRNGAGKTTISAALKILQRIACGTNRVRELVQPADYPRGETHLPMRFEIEVTLDQKSYRYVIAFEFPEGYRELRVLEESLTAGGVQLYSRAIEKVRVPKSGKIRESVFSIDWHLVALPLVQEVSKADPLSIFRTWLGRVLILRPLPSLILGDSRGETLTPDEDVTNLGAWFTGILALSPSAYSKIDEYLRQIMPDFEDIKNPPTGSDARSLRIQFRADAGRTELPFKSLSDGEKCYVICALVLAAQSAYGPLVCFWDEPDNHLALSEVGHFILTLRRSFLRGGQFIATSHNSEAIHKFSDENTIFLDRKSHLEPAIVRRASELQKDGNTVEALLTGDLAV